MAQSRDETLIPIPRWAVELFLDQAEFGDTWPDEVEHAYATIYRALSHDQPKAEWQTKFAALRAQFDSSAFSK